MPAFERFPGEVSEDEIIRCLQAGSMVLWVAWEDEVIGGALTEIVNYSGGVSAVRVVGVGGLRFEAWRERLDEVLEKFARVWGCDRLEMYGRKGWERRLPNWNVNRIMMIREVTDG